LYKFYLVDFKLFEQFQFFAISITLQEESKVWKEEKIKKFLKLVFKSVQVQEPEAQEKVKEELREKVKVPISVREEEEEEIIL